MAKVVVRHNRMNASSFILIATVNEKPEQCLHISTSEFEFKMKRTSVMYSYHMCTTAKANYCT